MRVSCLLRRFDDERGSIPIAMLAILIISALVGVTSATILAGNRQTQYNDGYERALQVAEIGVERMSAIIEKNRTPPADTGWVAVGPDRYQTITTSDISGWTIRSTGHARGSTADRTAPPLQRRVVVRIQRPRLFYHGLFGDVSVHVTGGSRRMTSYSSATGIYSGATVAEGNLATLASNEAVHAAGSVNGGTIVYPPAQRFDVSTDAAVAFITNALAECDAAGRMQPTRTITDLQTISPSTWRPDPWMDTQNFYCFENLHFAANSSLTVQGASAANPVKIFVRGAVTFERNAAVNCATGCVANEDAPNAGALQIYTSSSQLVSFGKDVRLAAALYAPRAQCAGGANLTVFGAMVCRVTGEFTGHMRLYYDETLRVIQGANFRRWTEEHVNA